MGCTQTPPKLWDWTCTCVAKLKSTQLAAPLGQALQWDDRVKTGQGLLPRDAESARRPAGLLRRQLSGGTPRRCDWPPGLGLPGARSRRILPAPSAGLLRLGVAQRRCCKWPAARCLQAHCPPAALADFGEPTSLGARSPNAELGTGSPRESAGGRNLQVLATTV